MFNKDPKKKETEKEKEDPEKIDIKEEIKEWVIAIEAAVILAVVLNMFIIVNAVIPSASMESTIMTGDRIFGNRLAYINSDPQRGDIIIFKFPDDEKQLFIKRVIGLPGETVEMIDGKIYIDNSDTPLNEPYVMETPLGNYGPVTVPEGAYFVMGDNRNNSADSRYWVNTFVYKEKILGRAVFRYFRQFGKIEESHPTY
ncbi:MAG: signal peptidase I [Lachnospiraceae bacterium]|nr:signal peptidase I [Lachnospiraceae bacterium]